MSYDLERLFSPRLPARELRFDFRFFLDLRFLPMRKRLAYGCVFGAGRY